MSGLITEKNKIDRGRVGDVSRLECETGEFGRSKRINVVLPSPKKCIVAIKKKYRITVFFFFIVLPTRTYRSGPVPVRQAGRKTYGY